MDIHPAPYNCNDYVRKLHGRSVQIVLGENLNKPSEFVICWTPGGKAIGGSGIGIKLAEREGITVYNLAKCDDLLKVHKRFLSGEKDEQQ
ncbi:hypothetical protein LCGC14_2375210 [marine sediment metagenome]|uniref:Uncharacterized protein n=1 Tax=marine sediment metagenome TaxID=412755 RepID=A0A0F9EEZ8_9ZZZZ